MIKLKVNTDQEAFDTVVRHLAAMDKRATVGTVCLSICRYIDSEGRRCAISVLLDCTDAERRRLDDAAVSGIEILIRDGLVDIGSVSPTLLSSLQNAHDLPSYWCSAKGFIGWAALGDIARRWTLNTSVLEEVSAS